MQEDNLKLKKTNNSKKYPKGTLITISVLVIIFIVSLIYGLSHYTPISSSDTDSNDVVMSPEKAKKEFILDTKNLLKKHGISDAKIKSIPDGTMAGFTLLKVNVSSQSFSTLPDSEKTDFLTSWNSIDYSQSKLAVTKTVISNGDIYETNYGIAMVNGGRLNQEIIKDETIEEVYTEPIPLGPEYPKFAYGDDKKFAFEAAKSTVLSVLFSPSTAIFPNELNDGDVFEMSPGVFSIKSYGDSQNKFGAMLRFQYIVEIERLDWNSYKVLDVIIE